MLQKHAGSKMINHKVLGTARVWEYRMWLLLRDNGRGKADVFNAVLLWSSLMRLLLVSNRTNSGSKPACTTKKKGFRKCLGKLEVFKLDEPVEHHSQTFKKHVKSQRCWHLCSRRCKGWIKDQVAEGRKIFFYTEKKG